MLFRDLPDAVHSTDIAISDELTEEITRKFGFVFAEKSEDEILSDSSVVYTQTRDIEERRLKREKSKLCTVDLPFYTSIMKDSIHVFVS